MDWAGLAIPLHVDVQLDFFRDFLLCSLNSFRQELVHLFSSLS
jgi:hypothetical protein